MKYPTASKCRELMKPKNILVDNCNDPEFHSIMEKIVRVASSGHFTTSIDEMSKSNLTKLRRMGYVVTLDDSSVVNPFFNVSWK